MSGTPRPGAGAGDADPSVTATVVRNHLAAFLEQRGIAAIVADYADTARFHSEAAVHRGKQEIGAFFADFLGSLPAGAVGRFSLRSLRVDGNVAYITWQVGSEIPLGTDTFVVEGGKIVLQTFAMHPAPAPSTAGVGGRGHPNPVDTSA